MTPFQLGARTLDEYVEAFRKTIELGWPEISSVDPNPESDLGKLSEAVGDWLQMLWEYLVEGMLRWTKQLDGYLVFYAGGVDGGMSMRYSEPEARYTHEVCFVPREGSSLRDRISNREIVFPERGLALEEFVSCTDERPYARRPPFNFVQARDVPESLDAGYPLLFAREDVRFILSVAEPDYY